MSRNRFLLPIILLLLVLTLPLGIYGLILHNKEALVESNPNKEHKYNGELYYYDKTGKFLGKYTCISEDCDDVKTVTTDKYLNITSGTKDTISVVNGSFALVSDEGMNKLIILATGMTNKIYKEVINYGYEDIAFVIVKGEDDLYSVLSTTSIGFVTPADYKYIGFMNTESTAGLFAVSKDNKYYIIRGAGANEEEKLSAEFNSPIYYYTDTLIILKSGNSYGIFDYEGNKLVNTIKKMEIFNDQIFVLDSSNQVTLYKSNIDFTIYNEEDAQYDFERTDEGIVIKKNDEIIETIN